MDLTAEQLSQYNGTDASKPIYVAIKGRIFDVTTGKSFYGPGGSYAMFAGKDASRALAKMSKNEEDISPSLHGLTEKVLTVLGDWEKKFEAKYPVEPVLPGCFLRAKAIGLMSMIDQGEKDKIIVVCADDPEYRDYNDIKELPPHRMAEIRHFEDYKKNENKEVAINDFLPASDAYDAIQHSLNLYADYIVESLRR